MQLGLGIHLSIHILKNIPFNFNIVLGINAGSLGLTQLLTQYVTLKASEGIVVEDNRKFIENYEELLQRLGNIDKELDEVRSRFVKEA